MNFKVILLTVIIVLNLKSQTIDQIVGNVYDDKKFEPIKNVQVYIEELKTGTYTDINGYFSISGIAPGEYKIIFKHVAYNEKSIRVYVHADRSIHVRVYMNPRVIEFEPVYKFSSSYSYLSNISEQVRIIKNDGTAKSLEELLKKDSRVLLRKDPYGNTVIQISGSSLEHVVVMVDGNPVSDSKKGYINSDIVPVEFIESIEIVSGSVSAIAGNSAIGGVINIITKKKKEDSYNIDISKGTFGYNKQFLTLSKNFGSVDVVLGAGQEFATNNYPYKNIYGKIVKKVGNEYLKNRFVFKLKCKTKKNRHVGLMAILEKSNFGVPGNIYNPTIGSKNKNENIIFSINVGGISKKLKFFYNQFKNSYVSPWSIYGRINTNYEIKAGSLELDRSYNLKLMNINLYSGLKFEKMLSEDLVRPSLSMGSRERYIFYSAINAVIDYQMSNSIIRFSLPLRVDYASDYKENFSSYLEFSYKKNLGLVSLKFIAGLGSSFKLPTFNQLYWIGDIYSQGNTDLKPERGIGFSFGNNLGFRIMNLPCHFEVFYSNNEVKDIIIWRRAYANKYIPVNNDIAKVENFSSYLNIKLSRILNTYFGFSINRAINKTKQPNLYGKYLPYRPLTQGNFTLEYDSNKFYFKIMSEYFGKNYVTEANTVYLDSYWLFNFTVGYLVKIYKENNLDISFRIDNIFNREYYMLEFYPMPRRQFVLNISIG